MRVTIPKSALEVGKKKSEKICPKCDKLVHVAIRICPKCGHEWTVEENEKIIATQMPELKTVLFKKKEKEIIVTTPAWYIVYDMMAHLHESKKNNKMLGKISLYYGDFDHVYNVFICMPDFYDGYAVEKAKEIWKKFSAEPFPKDIKEFNELSRSIKKPERILLSTDGKWPKLIDIDFELPF
jgi:RNA polymerase subunit RPABC4/transcription elongation factor Spt4